MSGNYKNIAWILILNFMCGPILHAAALPRPSELLIDKTLNGEGEGLTVKLLPTESERGELAYDETKMRLLLKMILDNPNDLIPGKYDVISSLAECNCIEFKREANNHVKDFITEQTRRYGHELPGKNNEPLNFTSLGSGDLFSDLISLTNLIDAGFNKINVRLIDILYADFIKAPSDDFQATRKRQVTQFLAWFNIYLPKLLNRTDIQVNLDMYGDISEYANDYSKQPSALQNDIVHTVDVALKYPGVIESIDYLINTTLRNGGWAFFFKRIYFIVTKICQEDSCEKGVNFIIEYFNQLDPSDVSDRLLLKKFPTYPTGHFILFRESEMNEIFSVRKLKFYFGS